MPDERLSVEIKLKAEFYDVDCLRVVWHGNYLKYLEQARSALFDLIGYNYPQMEESGYAWPIVDVRLKYVKPVTLGQEFIVRSILLEFEHRIKIAYRILDAATGALLHKAESIQMAVDCATGKSLFFSPPCLVNAVHAKLNAKGQSR